MKKEVKKLVLKKEIISNLSQNEMTFIIGGYGVSDPPTGYCGTPKTTQCGGTGNVISGYGMNGCDSGLCPGSGPNQTRGCFEITTYTERSCNC